MNWKQSNGIYEIDDLLKLVKDIEFQCASDVKTDDTTKIESEYLKHKNKLFELYNTASTTLDKLENDTDHPVLSIKVNLEGLISQMKMEVQELRKICNKYYSNTQISRLNKKDNKYLEIENYEREFILITQSRLNKLFIKPCFKMTYSTTLNDFLHKPDSLNKFEHKMISDSNITKIREWNLENKRIDKEIAEIGNKALRIADRAEQLGYEAKAHKVNIEEIKDITEFTTSDVKNLNKKVQEVINTNSNATFCCRITLVTLVFISVSIIIVLIFKKLF